MNASRLQCGLFVLLAWNLPLPAQVKPTVSRVQVGSSAVSVNALSATAYRVGRGLADCVSDSLGETLFISTGSGDKGMLAAINANSDSLGWTTATVPGKLFVGAGRIVSAGSGSSAVYGNADGREQAQLPGQVLFLPTRETAVIASAPAPGEIKCVSLVSGAQLWSAAVPSGEDWNDIRKLSDSVWLVGASGLHALNTRSGLLWSLPLSTSVKPSSPPSEPAEFNTGRVLSSAALRSTGASNGLVTQLASDIVAGRGMIYFAGREKLVACDRSGRIAWSYAFENAPTSRMDLFLSDSALFLVNTGFAMYGDKAVKWGEPFFLKIDPSTGRVLEKVEGEMLEGLRDVLPSGKRLRIATREIIFEAGSGNLRTLSLIDPSYGRLNEIIDAGSHHALKDGYFVPLNRIDRAPYYRSDNNKIYALDRNNVKYEYSASAVYRLERRHKGRVFLMNSERTLVTDENFELLCSLKLSGRSMVAGNKVYFVSGESIYGLALDEMK